MSCVKCLGCYLGHNKELTNVTIILALEANVCRSPPIGLETSVPRGPPPLLLACLFREKAQLRPPVSAPAS